MENHGCISQGTSVGEGICFKEIKKLTGMLTFSFMFKLVGLMERDLKYLAELETYNNGKPMRDAVFDIYGAMYALKYYAGWADKIHGQSIPAGNPYFHISHLSFL